MLDRLHRDSNTTEAGSSASQSVLGQLCDQQNTCSRVYSLLIRSFPYLSTAPNNCNAPRKRAKAQSADMGGVTPSLERGVGDEIHDDMP